MRAIENSVLKQLEGSFVNITDEVKRRSMITYAAKTIAPSISGEEINALIKDINELGGIARYISDQNVEDVMINNTASTFIFDSDGTSKQVDVKYETKEDLELLVGKLKLYATNKSANGNIMDVHLPTGSRANIVTSPLGPDVTIRNFRSKPLSIIDLINSGELDYHMAARLWLYVDGFRIRPANMLIGGVPAAGKTTLLNAMFSFFRPEQRVITIEDTYELNTEHQENVAKLETSGDLTLQDLVKNALRMRPDLIVIGEVRGSEANDLIAAMNVGKICMGTIHASSTRDIVNRLEHSPMNVPQDIIPVIDALLVMAPVFQNGVMSRKIVQMSEISGIETQILLSDLYRYDYKTHQAAPILPSVTYRDLLSKILGVVPSDILAEEAVRARILEQMNRLGKRSTPDISEVVKEYYYTPEALLKKIGLGNVSPIIRV